MERAAFMTGAFVIPKLLSQPERARSALDPCAEARRFDPGKIRWTASTSASFHIWLSCPLIYSLKVETPSHDRICRFSASVVWWKFGSNSPAAKKKRGSGDCGRPPSGAIATEKGKA